MSNIEELHHNAWLYGTDFLEGGFKDSAEFLNAYKQFSNSVKICEREQGYVITGDIPSGKTITQTEFEQ